MDMSTVIRRILDLTGRRIDSLFAADMATEVSRAKLIGHMNAH